MKKNPILVFTGLAVAAVGAVAGLTRDQWMNSAPQQIAGAEVAQAPKTQPDAAPADSAGAPAQPAAEQPAAEQPAAKAEVPAQPTTETPAATAEAPAAAEQQTAAVQPEQAAPAAEAAAPATDKPAASAPPPAAEAAKEGVPTFDTVRIEKSGDAVIAGTAEAGAEVVVKLDGEAIGKTVANSDGAFVVVPDAPIPSGSGALTIEATGKGDAAPTQSEESVAVIVPASEEKDDALVALVSPDAPTKVLQKPAPEPEAPATQVAAADPAAEPGEGEAAAEPAAAPEPAAEKPTAAAPAAKPAQLVSIDAVDYDVSGNIVFSGRGEPGNGARIYVDNKFVGDAAVGNDGRWSFAGTADIAQGVHALRVDGIDAKGTVINRVEVPFFREDTKKVVAAATPAEPPAPAADQTMAKTTPEPAPATETPLAPEQQTAAVAANAEPEAAAREVPRNGRVVIQPGNNLWRISRVLYGSGTKYTLLYQANKDQIRDPDMIYPGQIFTTPDVASKVETIDPDRRDPLTPEENAASAQQN